MREEEEKRGGGRGRGAARPGRVRVASRRPKMAAAVGNVCGAAGAGAAAEARFISSAKVSPAGPSAAGVPSLPSCFSKANFDGAKGVKKSPAASPQAGRGVPSAAGWVSASLPDPAFSLGREKVYSPPRTSAKGKLCSWRGRWSRRSSSGTPCTTTEVRGGWWRRVPVTCPGEGTWGTCPGCEERVWVWLVTPCCHRCLCAQCTGDE